MRFTIFFVLILSNFLSGAQNIAAFTDYRKNFWAFDSGNFVRLEYQEVLDYQVGDKCIGYISNGNKLKVYMNNETNELGSLVDEYIVTNNLVSYKLGGSQLYVFEDGKSKLLSKFVGHYSVGDSVVAYFDKENYLFQIYYNGNIRTIADGLLYSDVQTFFVGDNIVAYIDTYRNFKVFYQGRIYGIMNTDIVFDIKIGRNVMAFVEPSTNYLNVFYNGEVQEIETFKPKSFQVGYEKVAYVDDVGNFKLFDNGYVYEVSNVEPESYLLKDNILVYNLSGQIYVFYKGESYMIENYIPGLYKISDNTIVYIDINGNLKMVQDGERRILTYENVNDFEVYRNVIVYNQGVNTVKVYYDGKEYNP